MRVNTRLNLDGADFEGRVGIAAVEEDHGTENDADFVVNAFDDVVVVVEHAGFGFPVFWFAEIGVDGFHDDDGFEEVRFGLFQGVVGSDDGESAVEDHAVVGGMVTVAV